MRRAWLYTLGTVAVALTPTAIALFPLEGYRIVHLISGPGGSAFVSGMRSASVAGIVPFLVVPFAVAKDVQRRLTTTVAALFLIITLIGPALTA